MIKGLDNLKTWIKANRLIKWNVKTNPDKDMYVFLTDDVDDDMATKMEKFDLVISTLSPGRYYVDGNKTNSTRGWFRETFMLLPRDIPTDDPELAPEQAAPAQPAAVYGTPDEINARISCAVENERLKIKVDRMKELIDEKDAYIRELEKEIEDSADNSPLNKMVSAINPYIPAIAQRFFGGATPAATSSGIAGVPDDPETSIDQLLDRVSVLFDEENPVAFLQRLLVVLEANPTYIPMIKALTKNE